MQCNKMFVWFFVSLANDVAALKVALFPISLTLGIEVEPVKAERALLLRASPALSLLLLCSTGSACACGPSASIFCCDWRLLSHPPDPE